MRPVPPITFAQIPAEWIEMRREMIARDRLELRPGQYGTDLSGEPFTIEVKSIARNMWLRLALPDGAHAFTTADEREAVLRQLRGVTL